MIVGTPETWLPSGVAYMLWTMASAASLVHQTRTKAGLSCRGLALRAGVPASTVSRIEQGSMDPTLTMLRRVVAGASQRLIVQTGTPDDGPSIAALAPRAIRSEDPLKIDWTLLRGFADWARRHPAELAAALEDPPMRTATPVDAILASFTEELCRIHELPAPRWTADVPPLEHRWEPEGTPRMLERARTSTPAAFRDRCITLARSTLFRDAKPA